jgi:hypothetical protein
LNQEEILKIWCEGDKIDYEIVKILKEKIYPLLENAHKIQGDSFDRALLEQKIGTEIRLNNSANLVNILHRKLDPNKFSKKDVKTLSLHLEFLPLVEGFFAIQINFLIFVLIADNHDFYLTRQERYAKSLDEIEGEDIAYKLKFLKNHNFPELSANEKVIRKIRNSAAHLFYEITDEGNFKVNQDEISEKSYNEFYDYLRNIAVGIQNIQNLFYMTHMTSLSLEQIKRLDNVVLEKIKCKCGYINLLPNDRKTLGRKYFCTKCEKPIE